MKVLFLCTGNSCRSQMAEGWAKKLKGDRFLAFSAGTDPHGMNPLAMKVMQEVDVDLSSHSSKHYDTVKQEDFDYIITVCGSAHESCPLIEHSAKVVHRGFEDPPKLAANASSEEEALHHYRRVRDEIRAYIETLPEAL